MARKVRVVYEDAIYHVMARGNDRVRIFYDRSDYELFLKALSEGVVRHGVLVHAYCLMPNHYHLALQTPKANLPDMMRWFQTTFTARYNRKHKRVGHLYQGRYRAENVDTDDYLRTLLLYIHLNPIRSRKNGKATMCGNFSDLERFPWSSHADYSGRRSSPVLEQLETKWLRIWGRNSAEARSHYIKNVRTIIDRGELPDWKDRVEHGIVAGSKKLKQKIQDILKSKSIQSGEAIYKQINKDKRLLMSLDVLNGIEEKPIRIWYRVNILKQRPGDVSQQEGYLHPSGVTQVLKRLKDQCQRNKRLRMRLARLEKKSNIKY